jgi:hypothetical protein
VREWLTIDGVGGGARGSHGGVDDKEAVATPVELPVAGSASLSIGLGLDGGVVVAAVNLVSCAPTLISFYLALYDRGPPTLLGWTPPIRA